jgi:hypothetical protein
MQLCETKLHVAGKFRNDNNNSGSEVGRPSVGTSGGVGDRNNFMEWIKYHTYLFIRY